MGRVRGRSDVEWNVGLMIVRFVSFFFLSV